MNKRNEKNTQIGSHPELVEKQAFTSLCVELETAVRNYLNPSETSDSVIRCQRALNVLETQAEKVTTLLREKVSLN